MKIVLFAKTLGSTQLWKISQESSLLSNFGSLPKIRNACFGRCGPLGVKLLLLTFEALDNHNHLSALPMDTGNDHCNGVIEGGSGRTKFQRVLYIARDSTCTWSM